MELNSRSKDLAKRDLILLQVTASQETKAHLLMVAPREKQEKRSTATKVVPLEIAAEAPQVCTNQN